MLVTLIQMEYQFLYRYFNEFGYIWTNNTSLLYHQKDKLHNYMCFSDTMPHQDIPYIIIALVRDVRCKPGIKSSGVPGSSAHIMKSEYRYMHIYT